VLPMECLWIKIDLSRFSLQDSNTAFEPPPVASRFRSAFAALSAAL
jgi:hypothetical protein